MGGRAHIVGSVRDGETVKAAKVGDRVEIGLDGTPFYVEAGGQVSDTGVIRGDGWAIDVEDVRRPVGGLIVHVGEVVEGQPTTRTGTTVTDDAPRRWDSFRNHTPTPFLHAQFTACLGHPL